MAFTGKSNEELGLYLLELQTETEAQDKFYKKLFRLKVATQKEVAKAESILVRTERCVGVNRAEIAAVVNELARRGALNSVIGK